MTPSPQSPGAAPLPPLPNLSGGNGGGTASQGSAPGGFEQALSGAAPVKSGVDMILAGVKQIVKSGVIPGAEQIGGQIVALAVSFLPMAAQSLMQPSGGTGGSIGPVGAGGNAAPPMPGV